MSTIRLFASHDWGVNGANHARVAEVVAALRQRNFHVWFDETHMRGNILDAICRGMDSADVVLVFMTTNYMKKVESGNDTDNVRREFMYGAHNAPDKFLCVKFDTTLPDPWTGPASMILGARLYVDMSDGAVTSARVDALVDAIRHRTPRVAWKTAVQRTRATPVPHHPPRAGTGTGSAPRAAPEPLALRARVKRICDLSGTPPEADAHLCKLVDRLHLSLVGTVDPSMPLVDKIKRMETNLGM